VELPDIAIFLLLGRYGVVTNYVTDALNKS